MIITLKPHALVKHIIKLQKYTCMANNINHKTSFSTCISLFLIEKLFINKMKKKRHTFCAHVFYFIFLFLNIKLAFSKKYKIKGSICLTSHIDLPPDPWL